MKTEGIKQLYDSLKHMTTLSTGSLLLVVTFLEKLFTNPEWKFTVTASLLLLVVTIFLSVSGMFFASLGVRDIEDGDKTKWPDRAMDCMGYGYFSFFSGLLVLSVFFIKNFH